MQKQTSPNQWTPQTITLGASIPCGSRCYYFVYPTAGADILSPLRWCLCFSAAQQRVVRQARARAGSNNRTLTLLTVVCCWYTSDGDDGTELLLVVVVEATAAMVTEFGHISLCCNHCAENPPLFVCFTNAIPANLAF